MRQDWEVIGKQFQKVQYVWVIPILMATVLNYLWRAWRWRLLLQALAYPPENAPNLSLQRVFRAVMVGYFVNLALPRVGELARIWALRPQKDKDSVFLWQTFGTVLTERLLDVFCLCLIILLFLSTHHGLLQNLSSPNLLGYLWLGIPILGVLVGLSWIIFRYLHQKGYLWWQSLIQGLWAIARLRRQGWLWLYTILIWWSYVAMSYYWFFALPATAHLGWNVAFAMVALGTLSRVVPLQANSAGVYHSLVVWALGLYGVPEATAFTLTLLIHSTQLVFTLCVGGFCWLWWVGFGRQVTNLSA